MSANTNTVRQPSFFDHPADDGYAHGAYVTVDGEKKMLGMHRVRLLQGFAVVRRNEAGKRIRASAELTPEQVKDLGGHGIRFEPAANKPGFYHLDCEVEVGKFYRQGYY